MSSVYLCRDGLAMPLHPTPPPPKKQSCMQIIFWKIDLNHCSARRERATTPPPYFIYLFIYYYYFFFCLSKFLESWTPLTKIPGSALDYIYKRKKKCTVGCTITTLIYSSEVSTYLPNYKSQKSIKIFKKSSVICTTFEFSYELYLTQN